MITNDLIRYYEDRADNLRKEIINSIIDLLKENDLTELQLSKCPEKQPWVVWFDNRNYGYDSRVTKVAIDGKGISIEVYDEDCCCTETLKSEDSDLACRNIDWLCCILDSAIYTLSLPLSVGTTTIAGKTIRWHYDERGIAEELPESEIDTIISELNKGKTSGPLYHSDGDEEFEGEWSVIEPSTIIQNQ